VTGQLPGRQGPPGGSGNATKPGGSEPNNLQGVNSIAPQPQASPDQNQIALDQAIQRVEKQIESGQVQPSPVTIPTLPAGYSATPNSDSSVTVTAPRGNQYRVTRDANGKAVVTGAGGNAADQQRGGPNPTNPSPSATPPEYGLNPIELSPPNVIEARVNCRDAMEIRQKQIAALRQGAFGSITFGEYYQLGIQAEALGKQAQELEQKANQLDPNSCPPKTAAGTSGDDDPQAAYDWAKTSYSQRHGKGAFVPPPTPSEEDDPIVEFFSDLKPPSSFPNSPPPKTGAGTEQNNLPGDTGKKTGMIPAGNNTPPPPQPPPSPPPPVNPPVGNTPPANPPVSGSSNAVGGNVVASNVSITPASGVPGNPTTNAVVAGAANPVFSLPFSALVSLSSNLFGSAPVAPAVQYIIVTTNVGGAGSGPTAESRRPRVKLHDGPQLPIRRPTRIGGTLQNVAFHPDEASVLRARDSTSGPGIPSGSSSATSTEGGISFSLAASGTLGSGALEFRVGDPSGRVKNIAIPEGVVLEPLRPGVMKPAGATGEGAVSQHLTAYCLEIAKLPPEPNQLYRIAPQAIQDRFKPLKSVLEAGSKLAASGQFHPDSDAAAYTDFVRQNALWAQIENWGEQKFTEVFVERTKKTAEHMKINWTKEMEQALQNAAPGRWRDIAMVLDEAQKLSGGAGTANGSQSPQQ
jgi:hypothetical protein